MSGPLEIKENTILVILGASGDLAKKKLVTSFPLIPLLNADTLTSFQHYLALSAPTHKPNSN